MSAISAVIIAKQRKYIRALREAGAVSAGSSILLSDHNIRTSMIFDRLVRQGIIVQVGEDRYYLDEEKEQEVRKRRLPILLVILIFVLIAFLIAMNASR